MPAQPFVAWQVYRKSQKERKKPKQWIWDFLLNEALEKHTKDKPLNPGLFQASAMSLGLQIHVAFPLTLKTIRYKVVFALPTVVCSLHRGKTWKQKGLVQQENRSSGSFPTHLQFPLFYLYGRNSSLPCRPCPSCSKELPNRGKHIFFSLIHKKKPQNPPPKKTQKTNRPNLNKQNH